jgi:N-acetylmuramoyl-L-alanine amidase
MKRYLWPLAVIFLVLSPLSAGARDFTNVVIDPGHGGYDFGLDAGGKREKDIALAIAKKLKQFLRQEGKQVYLTREVDRHLSLADRRELIDKRSPEVLVSIHLSDTDSAVVYVTWYKDTEAELSLSEYYSLESRQRRYLYESRVLASTIGDAMGSEFGMNVYYGELPLPLLSATGAPAVLVELPAKDMNYNDDAIQRFSFALGIGLQLYGQK